MRNICLLLFLLPAAALAAFPKPKAVFEVSKDLAQPESAYYHAESGALFVSNVAGTPFEKDGRGWIAKLDRQGKILDPRWVDGLDAPKGMRAAGGRLYVADIDRLVEIDLAEGKVLRRLEAKGAKLLNDVAVGEDGTVYVSDTLGSAIYRLAPKAKRLEVFMKGPELESPNGLYVRRGRLYVAAWGLAAEDLSTKTPGRLYSIDLETRELEYVTPEPLGNLDGLERATDGAWIVSDWVAGKVFRIYAGRAAVVLEGLKGPADLGYDPDRNMLFLPRMQENLLTAYGWPSEPRDLPVPEP